MDIVYNGENRFALSIIVFEKMDAKFGVRIRPTFKIYAAVDVYSRRAFLLALI